MRHVGFKTRSLGQIFEKSCLLSGGDIFCPTLLKFGHDGYPDDISKEFENGSCFVKS